jgi:hypothetical protein
MWILFLLVIISSLIQPTIAEAGTRIHKDSTNQASGNKSYSVRFIFSLSPILSTFSKLSMRTPSYNNPAIRGEKKINLAGFSPEVGLAYRRLNMIFKAGPVSSHTDSTSKDKYNESDSLALSDEYYLSRYSIEFSYSWYHHKLSRLPISLQIEPIVGYERFLREYDGEIQDLKIKGKLFPYYNRAVSSGIVFGGHVTLIYPRKRKQEIELSNQAIYGTDKGPFVSLAYRNFSNIRYFTFETGLLELNFETKTIVERSTLFFRIEKFDGAIKGRTYRVGVSLMSTFKTLFSE